MEVAGWPVGGASASNIEGGRRRRRGQQEQ